MPQLDRQINETKLEIEILKMETQKQRQPVSTFINEYLAYVQDKQFTDPLLMNVKGNPYKNKKKCAMM